MATAAKNSQLTKKILTAVIAVVLIAVVVLLIVLLTMKNGFVKEGDATYYYENGEKLVGWQIIDGDRYYFDADGKMHTGWLEANGNKYYFRTGSNGYDKGILLVKDPTVPADSEEAAWNGKATIAGVYYEFNEFGQVVVEQPVA